MEEFEDIELDNGKKYLLIKEVNTDGNKYFLAAGINPQNIDDSDIIEGDVKILKEIQANGKIYVEEINDEDTKHLVDLIATTDVLLDLNPALAIPIQKLFNKYFEKKIQEGSN